MSSTFGTFELACEDIPKQTIIRNLRRAFSEIVSKYDISAHKLIMALEAGGEDEYERTVLQYGEAGYTADEKLRTLLLKWCITGDCSSPR
jgi:hypothetical protein